MDTLLTVTITTENHPRDYSTRWVVSVAYTGQEDDPFLIFKTGNADEMQAAPYTLTGDMGYHADQVTIHHNY